MMIGDIKIERGVSGFIVYEDAGMGLMGKKWAFEDHERLAKFVVEWCEEPKPNNPDDVIYKHE